MNYTQKQNQHFIPLWSGSMLRGLWGGLLMISLLTSSFGQKEPIEVDKGYKVEIQTSAICEMCQYALEKDLAFEKGVKEATLNLDDKVMTVVYNPKKTDAQTIRKRITLVGYHADTLARDSIAYDNLPMCCKDGAHDTPIPQVPLPPKDGN
ncbi:heavy metal-associated domain-containing protein [Ekhidna sp.]|jgi:mercuric ion binding protein|uniref:heavy-metal-associated domain-containing protein n=1 Tax=Ekhidna sp. TaxID=2608089 RepID=UPI0032EBE82F